MTINAREAAQYSIFAYEGNDFDLPQAWKDLGWEVLLQGDRNDGYHGKAFVRIEDGVATDVVVAHRGTQPSDANDLLADVQLALQIGNQQHDDALNFLEAVEVAYE